MVDITWYNELVTGSFLMVYKATYIWEAPSCRAPGVFRSNVLVPGQVWAMLWSAFGWFGCYSLTPQRCDHAETSKHPSWELIPSIVEGKEGLQETPGNATFYVFFWPSTNPFSLRFPGRHRKTSLRKRKRRKKRRSPAQPSGHPVRWRTSCLEKTDHPNHQCWGKFPGLFRVL